MLVVVLVLGRLHRDEDFVNCELGERFRVLGCPIEDEDDDEDEYETASQLAKSLVATIMRNCSEFEGETPLGTSRYQIGFLAALVIVALRVGIGLHFYLEGMSKLRDPKPFSAAFLSNAKGPLAPLYRQMVWDADGLFRLNYDYTYHHWDDYKNRIAAHFRFDEPQLARAQEIFDAYVRRFAFLINEKQDDLQQYYGELKRRDANAADPARSLTSLAAHDARITQDRTALAAPVLATIDKLWKDLENDLNSLATAEQYKRHGRLPIGKVARRLFDSEFMDRWVPYFDIAVGACLILGLFTRPAALAGGLFLLSVCLSQWPLTAGAVPIYYQAVEMLALFALAAIGAGNYAGLDFLLGGAYRMCCGKKPAAAGSTVRPGAKR